MSHIGRYSSKTKTEPIEYRSDAHDAKGARDRPRVRSWAKPLSDASFLGEWTFDFSPLGLRIHRPHADSTTSWTAVREIASSGDHIFIWTDSIAALLVPIRDFPAGLSSERAQTILHGLRNQVGAPSEVVDAEAKRAPQPPRTTTRSMRALVRWLTWRTFDGQALNAPDLAIAFVSVLCFALPIGLARIGVGSNAEFSYFGAQVLACKALAVLALGWIT